MRVNKYRAATDGKSVFRIEKYFLKVLDSYRAATLTTMTRSSSKLAAQNHSFRRTSGILGTITLKFLGSRATS